MTGFSCLLFLSFSSEEPCSADVQQWQNQWCQLQPVQPVYRIIYMLVIKGSQIPCLDTKKWQLHSGSLLHTTVEWIEQWQPKRNKILSQNLATTLPPGYVLTYKRHCMAATHLCNWNLHGPFSRAVLPTEVAPTADRKTKALTNPPPRSVSPLKLYILCQWQQPQWCSANYCRQFLLVHYLHRHKKFPLPGVYNILNGVS